jgi:hypothetical protein
MLSSETTCEVTMNRVKAVLTLSAVLLGAGASAPAFAWHHGHVHSSVRFGVFVGAPLYPWYYPPYYYYPPYPVATVPATPQTYIEQGGAHPAPPRTSYWYYCAESKTYYPYVKECPGGWQRVAPQPAPGG